MNFSKEVVEGVKFRSCDQLRKVWSWDFGNVSCWMFGQKMNGVRTVGWNGKALKFEVFIGHL